MNALIAQLYGTQAAIEKTAAANTATQVAEQEPAVDPLDAAIFEEIEKTAAANNFDLNELSDDELLEVMTAYKTEFLASQAAGTEKTAATVETTPVENDSMVEADLAGRTMAHAFFQELGSIQTEIDGQEKFAGISDEELFEQLAIQRAENILQALSGNGEGFMKEASMEVDAGSEELDDLITQRCAEVLDAAGFDVEAIAAALEGN